MDKPIFAKSIEDKFRSQVQNELECFFKSYNELLAERNLLMAENAKIKQELNASNAVINYFKLNEKVKNYE